MPLQGVEGDGVAGCGRGVHGHVLARGRAGRRDGFVFGGSCVVDPVRVFRRVVQPVGAQPVGADWLAAADDVQEPHGLETPVLSRTEQEDDGGNGRRLRAHRSASAR